MILTPRQQLIKDTSCASTCQSDIRLGAYYLQPSVRESQYELTLDFYRFSATTAKLFMVFDIHPVWALGAFAANPLPTTSPRPNSYGRDICQDTSQLKMSEEFELQRRCAAIRGRYEVASYWLVPKSSSSSVLGSPAVASARKTLVSTLPATVWLSKPQTYL